MSTTLTNILGINLQTPVWLTDRKADEGSPTDLYAPETARELVRLQHGSKVEGWSDRKPLSSCLLHGIKITSPALGANGASLAIERDGIWHHKATYTINGQKQELPVRAFRGQEDWWMDYTPKVLQVQLPNGHIATVSDSLTNCEVFNHRYGLELEVVDLNHAASVACEFRESVVDPRVSAILQQGSVTKKVELRSDPYLQIESADELGSRAYKGLSFPVTRETLSADPQRTGKYVLETSPDESGHTGGWKTFDWPSSQVASTKQDTLTAMRQSFPELAF